MPAIQLSNNCNDTLVCSYMQRAYENVHGSIQMFSQHSSECFTSREGGKVVQGELKQE